MPKITKYTYHIDLNERGYFQAHVENSRGRVIVRYDLPVIYSECLGCGETFSPSDANKHECTVDANAEWIDREDWDIFSDWVGAVKHFEDIAGLEKHYKSVGMMPANAELVMGD